MQADTNQRDVLERLFPGDSEMARRMRAFDWSSTAAGPPIHWPESLKMAVRLALNSRYPMFIWWGAKALTYFYNDAYIPVLGAKHPGALGRCGALVWSEIWDTLGPIADAVFKEGRANWSQELPLVMERHGYREETFFTFSYSAIVETDGTVAGLFCACIEDTKRVVAERRLRTQRALAGEVAGALDLAEACSKTAHCLSANPEDLPFALLFLLDEDGEVARLASFTGLGDGSQLVAPEVSVGAAHDVWDLSRIARTRECAVVSGIEQAFVGGVPRGTWDEAPMQALVAPLSRPGYSVLAGFVVFGLSPRRAFDDDYRGFCELLAGHIATGLMNARAYEEERKRAEALTELDRAKTAFFSNVSHEFRTPLTLMLGPLEDVLAVSSLPASEREQLQVAHRNSLRLLKLVNTLLAFSRIEAGRIQASYEATDVCAYTKELASVFRSAIERAGLSFDVSCAPVSAPVFVDREMWEKIVLNLLSNAFKFTLSGGIQVTLGEQGSHVILSVRDTGTGIPANELPHVFERFHRVKGAQGRTHEGTGIGLALVQELVKLHGGSVTVESELGQGTTFTVTLPTGSAHLPQDRVHAERTLSPSSPGAAAYVEEALRWLPGNEQAVQQGSELLVESAHVPTAGARLLVADDNQDMRKYLRRLLSQYWTVDAVADGDAALAAIRQARPDLVLADLMMPKLDGFGLLRAIRADPSTRTLPVIMLSARAGEEARVEGLDAGVDDYLIKPFSARELIARVNAHLQLARARREADERKDEFLAMLAHELRNPLAPIQNACRILGLLGLHEPRLVRARDIIERQTFHLTRLVDDLLDVSRITRGKIALQREPVDIETVVQSAVEVVRPVLDRLAHSLTVTHTEEPARLEGDFARLVQVISNLLGNAAKFTPPGGRITLTTQQTAGTIVLRVRDSGVGMEPELLGKVFDLFVQEESGLARTQGGLGIGLTLVKRIAELHGGTVQAQSEGIGRGSEFTITLPALPASVSLPAPRHQPRPFAGNKSLRILLVEDNPDAAESLMVLLQLGGHDVQVAPDGHAALRAVETFSPDIAFIDVGLPGIDGYELAPRLRAHPLCHSSLLVALTGYGREEDKRRAAQAGFDHHLTKPVDFDAINRLLGHVSQSAIACAGSTRSAFSDMRR